MAADGALRVCLRTGFWLPLAVCTYLALTPSPPDAVSRVSDVVLHAAAFTYLTFALTLAHPGTSGVVAGAWMLGYGLLLEVVQSFEPARSAELKDLLVDLAGIAAGLILARVAGTPSRRLLGRRLPGRRNRPAWRLPWMRRSLR